MQHQTIELAEINHSVFGFGNTYRAGIIESTTAVTLSGVASGVQLVDAGSTDIDVVLPAAKLGASNRIVNVSASATLSVKDADSNLIGVVPPGGSVEFFASATKWYSLGGQGGGNAPPVVLTSSTVTVTRGGYDGRSVLLTQAAPFTVTLPAPVASGMKVQFVFGVAATATSSIIAAPGTAIVEGYIAALTTSSDNVIGWATSATSDKMEFNGTTKGGLPGDWIEFQDLEAGTWHVKGMIKATGSVATPFSAT